MDKKDILWELECAESNLDDDIQALAYIQEDLETTKKNTEMLLKIPEINNQIQILLKAMMYNKDKMKQAIDKYYNEVNKNKEEINNGNTSINNSVNQVVENPQV